MGMRFSCCAHAWDKVATDVGRQRLVVWRHRAEAGGAGVVGFETYRHCRPGSGPILVHNSFSN
jgi:hypothetical protein